jgi:6-phosphofructokinase 1
MPQPGNAIIAQSGGPTAVINASLVGAILEAGKHKDIFPNFWGSTHAVEGILKGELIDLYRQSSETLRRVASTPGSALYSSRKKIGEDIAVKDLLEAIVKRKVQYFFYIGGNDSADNAKRLKKEAKKRNYELRVFHIPKTIDNDLRNNDHTPGFGSAARYVASMFAGDNRDNLALPGIKTNIVMGRNAGFLTAAAGLLRKNQEDGPHLIYTPECPLDFNYFLRDVKTAYDKFGRAMIALSEGVRDETGKLIGWDGTSLDSHGNEVLDNSILASKINEALKKSKISKRIRTDVLGYAQRSFPLVSEIDWQEAYEVGRRAVEFAASGKESGSVAIKRIPGKEYKIDYELVPLESVAREARSMPREFMNPEGNNTTRSFGEYALPLIGKVSDLGSLDMIFVE